MPGGRSPVASAAASCVCCGMAPSTGASLSDGQSDEQPATSSAAAGAVRLRKSSCIIEEASSVQVGDLPLGGSSIFTSSVAIPPTSSTCTRILFRSEEHTSELQSLMRISSAVVCLKKKLMTHKNIQRTSS